MTTDQDSQGGVVQHNKNRTDVPLIMATKWSAKLRDLARETEDARRWRDERIREAHVNGTTIAELSRATGLTRTMLYKIIEKGHATG